MRPERLAADTDYGSAENLAWLVHEKGIEPHIPVFDKSARNDGIFDRSDFTFDHKRDAYICPGGKELKHFRRSYATPGDRLGATPLCQRRCVRYVTVMHESFAQHRCSFSHGPTRLLLLSSLFWIFTYALLSVRGWMIPETVSFVLSPQRLLAVTAGAIIFYAAVRHLAHVAAGPTLATIFRTFAISVAAALMIRLGLDQILFDTASASYSVRWTLVWTGYFGVWLIATLAYFDPVTTVRHPAVTSSDTIGQSIDGQPVSQADEVAWDWLVDILAAELVETGSLDRRAIATRLVTRAGYEQADCIERSADVQNARIRLAHSIASRI